MAGGGGITRAAVDEDEEEERGIIVDVETKADLSLSRLEDDEYCESEDPVFKDSGESRDLPKGSE